MFLSLIIDNTYSQITKISGTLTTKEGLGMPGANVTLFSTHDGTTSDLDGSFSFTTEEVGDGKIIISFIGYDSIVMDVKLNGSPIVIIKVLKENAKMLDEIVISVGSFEAVGDKKKMAVLNPLDIVLTASSSADITGALNTLPGTTRNGETGQLLVRGGAAYETRTFMDGLYVQNPYDNTVNNLPARNRFSPFLFKGTSFSTGGYSAEYGQAMSSALLLNTEDLAPKTSTGITLLSVGAGLSHTKRWSKTSLTVTGNYTNIKPYTSLVKQKVDWIKAPKSASAEIVYRRQISKKGGMLKLYSNINNSNLIMRPNSQYGLTSTNLLSQEASNTYTNISLKETIKNDWLIFAGAALSTNNDKIIQNFENVKAQQSFQGKITASKPISNNFNLKVGSEYLYSNYDETFINLNNQKKLTNVRDNFISTYGEGEFKLSRSIAGRAGIRAEYSSLINTPNLAPRLTLAYIFNKERQASIAYGKFYQTPEFSALQYQKELLFENAQHAIINFQQMKNGKIFRVELYKKWYNNLVKNQSSTSFTSNGKGYAQGLDLFLRDNSSIKNGDYWVSYSYLDTKRDWKDFPVLATPNFGMTHNVSIAAKKFFPKQNIALSTSYSYNTGRTYYNPTIEKSLFMTDKTPSFRDLSATFTYLTNVSGNFTVFYFSLQNVFGFNQTFSYRYNFNDQNANYTREAVTPPAKRFGVLAVIMTIGTKYKKNEVTSDDY